MMRVYAILITINQCQSSAFEKMCYLSVGFTDGLMTALIIKSYTFVLNITSKGADITPRQKMIRCSF